MNPILKKLGEIELAEERKREILIIGLLLLDYKRTANLMRANAMTSDDLTDTECFIVAKHISDLEPEERNISGYLMSLRCRSFSEHAQNERFEFAMVCIRSVWANPEFLGTVKFVAWKIGIEKGTIQ